MMKKLAIVPFMLLLAACQTDSTVVQTKLEVVLPDNSLYNCPTVRYPDYKNLTDEQVARLLVQLHRNNVTCRNSIDAIKKFLQDAKNEIENTDKLL